MQHSTLLFWGISQYFSGQRRLWKASNISNQGGSELLKSVDDIIIYSVHFYLTIKKKPTKITTQNNKNGAAFDKRGQYFL